MGANDIAAKDLEAYQSDRKIVHKEALINMLRSLSGNFDFEETKIFM